MLIERLTFQAKYGHGDALVDVMREFSKKYAADIGSAEVRICTDRTGSMFTVVVDSEHADRDAWAQAQVKARTMFGRSDWQAWFAKMQPLVERGDRQLLDVVPA